MARRKKVYEGKAKILYEGPEPGTLVQYFKDDGAPTSRRRAPAAVEGKGVLNNRLSEFFMSGLNADRRADAFHPPHQHARTTGADGRDHPAGGGGAQLRRRARCRSGWAFPKARRCRARSWNTIYKDDKLGDADGGRRAYRRLRLGQPAGSGRHDGAGAAGE